MTLPGQIGGSSPLAKGHTGPKGSTVVHRWIGTCNVTEDLKADGTDDVCEWWLLAGQYVGRPSHFTGAGIQVTQSNFEVFRPAGATHCTDGGEI